MDYLSAMYPAVTVGQTALTKGNASGSPPVPEESRNRCPSCFSWVALFCYSDVWKTSVRIVQR